MGSSSRDIGRTLPISEATVKSHLLHIYRKGPERERLTSQQLERYSSLPLCDLPRIRAELGRNRNVSIAFSLNGVTAGTAGSIDRVCAWRADEVELVEFGADICADVTMGIQLLFETWCSGRTRNVQPSAAAGGNRVGSQPGGTR